MPDYIFAYPGDFSLPTGGYEYDRRIHAELAELDWNGTLLSLGDGFPFPARETLDRAFECLAAQPQGMPILIDGLAFGVMSACSKELCRSHRIAALVHHPLGLETGLSPEKAQNMLECEKRILTRTKEIIVTSPRTATFLQEDFSIPGDRITVAVPGNDPASPSRGRDDGKVGLIAVGSIVPRKGYSALIEALNQLNHLDWVLDIVGDDRLDVNCATALRKQISDLNLSERVTLHGALQRKQVDALYAGADMFVLASRYEGYGMAFTEAVTYGLPIIATGHGAVRDTVPEKAGIVLPPEDNRAFRIALESLIADKNKRDLLRAGSLQAAKNLPRWSDTAATVRQVLESV
ncbi:MAG: glycosyltransferase family 4 protein [Stappiaceae bacterium]